jgi:hypothetical protein
MAVAAGADFHVFGVVLLRRKTRYIEQRLQVRGKSEDIFDDASYGCD